MLNAGVWIGRLTRDCESRATSGGTTVGRFTLAVDRPPYKGEKKTDFLDCVLWGKAAESLAQYLTKGKAIAVTGAVQVNEWEKDGQKQRKYEIKVNDVRFLPGSKGESKPDAGDFGQEISFSEEDLPF